MPWKSVSVFGQKSEIYQVKKTRHKASISIFVKKSDSYESVVIMDRIGTERGKVFNANPPKIAFHSKFKKREIR